MEMTRGERVSSCIRLDVVVALLVVVAVLWCVDRRRDVEFLSPADFALTLATVDIGVLTAYVLRGSPAVMIGVVRLDNDNSRPEQGEIDRGPVASCRRGANIDATAGHMAAGVTDNGVDTAKVGIATATEVEPMVNWSTVVVIQSPDNSSSSGAVNWRGESGSTSL